MILLEDYDPALKNWWWVEGTDLSSNVYLLNDGKVLIDTGNAEGLVSRLDEEFDVSKIEKIILTHSHFDHVGGLTELLHWCNPEILAHRNALPLIHFGEYSFTKLMESSGRAEKLVSLRGGEKIPAGEFELEIIHIPGHTMGHIAVYERNTRTLFSGDTVFPVQPETNMISAPDPRLGDIDQIVNSLKRLLHYDVKNLLPGHMEVVFEAGGEHIKNSLFHTIKEVEKVEDKAWIEVGQALAECERLDEAVACYDALLRLVPSHPEACLQKALVLTEKGEFESALAHFDVVLRRSPDLEEAIIGRGFALLGLGRMDEALQMPPFVRKLKHLKG